LARDTIHLIAGPIAYRQQISDYHLPRRKVKLAKWEFIGFTGTGTLRRWYLCFNTETRKFAANTLSVSDWDRAHARDLHAFYRPVAILRHDLPKGSITVAMKAMLTPEDIAEVTAIAMGVC
jgi:hypothetical protein